MKSNFINHFTAIFILTIMFISCTHDNQTNDANDAIENNQHDDRAILFQFGEYSLRDSLHLQVPTIQGDSLPRILFAYYNPKWTNSDIWFAVPDVNLEKDYKIEHSYQGTLENSTQTFKLMGERSSNSEPLDAPIEMRAIDIIAIEISALHGLTREDLDVWNYHEVVEFFGLENN